MHIANAKIVPIREDEASYFEENRVIEEFRDRDHLIPEAPFNFVVNHFPWFIWSAVMKKHVVLKAGLFDESFRISEDFDLIARMALLGAFGLYKSEEAICYEREGDQEGLTRKAYAERITVPDCNIRICKKLLSMNGITVEDRRAINQRMSSTMRNIGNYRLTTGAISEARELFRQALIGDPSLVTITKYICSFLPISINRSLMKMNERRKKRQLQKIKRK